MSDFDTPAPLSDSPVLALLGDSAAWSDECSDAMTCPGKTPEEWRQASDEIRYHLFSIREARENGQTDVMACIDLATAILRNIERHIEGYHDER